MSMNMKLQKKMFCIKIIPEYPVIYIYIYMHIYIYVSLLVHYFLLLFLFSLVMIFTFHQIFQIVSSKISYVSPLFFRVFIFQN